jgi:SAM-dependent methyltransferase
MDDLKQTIISYSSRDLEQRKNWYSPAAEVYNKARPHYPEALIEKVVEVAQLGADSNILEVGSGPATATVAFAPLGCSMVCLEPNPDFFRLAQQNCQTYPQIEIQNTSFEEWTPAVKKFDAVLAASSFHWISPEVGYPKAAHTLKEKGSLILLWNKELQPRYEVYQSLSKVYQQYAPLLDRYEDRETQEAILQGLGQMALDSGHFKDLVAGTMVSEVTYSTDEYLMLLNTYSSYLKLEQQQKDALFAGLRNSIERDFGGSLQLSYISAFHKFEKKSNFQDR